MIPIRTKLVLAQLLITLLPVFPLYLLVKGFLEQSLEIGLNTKVESALEQAAGISQKLYAKHKAETLDLARRWAASDRVRRLLRVEGDSKPVSMDDAGEMGRVRIALYNATGELVSAHGGDSRARFPDVSGLRVLQSARETEAGLIEGEGDPRYISAYAPVISRGRTVGFLLVTKRMEESFVRGSQQIIEVHQMFKTLGWIRDDLKRSFLLAFFAVYTPFAVLAIGVGYWLSRRMTAPLVALAKGTQRVGQGDWDYRLEARSNDEVGQLVRAFNTMVTTLKEKQDHLIALEKMAVWREIARILAHEIKNPLTPIQLTVQQLKDKYPGDDPDYSRLLAECTEIVNDEIDSLRRLVREFSEFARMPQLSLVTGDLNELASEVRKLYPDRNLHLELDPQLPELRFDYEKLRRALINLIENALDSLEEEDGGKVTLRTIRRDESAVLEVSDTGCGIPAELLDKIFEPHFSTKKSGVGLGLAIVRRIVEEHGGRISVDSEEGGGTRFSIALPL